MYDPYQPGRFDPDAFPPLLRVTSLALSVLIVGAVLIETFLVGARIVA